MLVALGPTNEVYVYSLFKNKFATDLQVDHLNGFVISAKFTGWPIFGEMSPRVDRGWPRFPSNYFVK